MRERGSQAAKLSRMERFTSLRCLDLHDLGLKDVPPQLGDLAHLSCLYLQENYLRSLPVEGADGQGYRRLAVLDVGSQRCDALAEMMDTACTHLTLPLAAALSLPRSIKALCLAGLGLRHLPAILSRLHELEVLDRGNNHCLDLSTSELRHAHAYAYPSTSSVWLIVYFVIVILSNIARICDMNLCYP